MEKIRISASLIAAANAAAMESPEPKDPEQYWVSTGDVDAADLGAILEIYGTLYSTMAQPADKLDLEGLLGRFKSSRFADIPIGGASLELRGLGLGPNDQPAFTRIKIIMANKKNTGILQDKIDAYFRDVKKVPLIPSRDAC